jgi:hypothetical protein
MKKGLNLCKERDQVIRDWAIREEVILDQGRKMQIGSPCFFPKERELNNCPKITQ